MLPTCWKVANHAERARWALATGSFDGSRVSGLHSLRFWNVVLSLHRCCVWWARCGELAPQAVGGSRRLLAFLHPTDDLVSFDAGGAEMKKTLLPSKSTMDHFLVIWSVSGPISTDVILPSVKSRSIPALYDWARNQEYIQGKMSVSQ